MGAGWTNWTMAGFTKTRKTLAAYTTKNLGKVRLKPSKYVVHDQNRGLNHPNILDLSQPKTWANVGEG